MKGVTAPAKTKEQSKGGIEMQLSKELIRFIRQTNRLSQREFADRIGVSNSYIALVENGIKPVTANLSEKITKEFDIDVDYIEAAKRFIDV